MAHQTNSAGDPRGTIPATAGSDKPEGDRPCPKCDGEGGEWVDSTWYVGNCPRCGGTGVEPVGEERTSSSALVPPAPSQMLAGVGPSPRVVEAAELIERCWRILANGYLAGPKGGTNQAQPPRDSKLPQTH